jgi:hypothetical protein
MSITIRFVQGTAFSSRLIVAQEKTAMPFTPSHVEALTPDGLWYLGAHDDGGVQKRPLGYDKAAMAHELLLALDTTPEQDAAFWKFLEGHIANPTTGRRSSASSFRATSTWPGTRSARR